MGKPSLLLQQLQLGWNQVCSSALINQILFLFNSLSFRWLRLESVSVKRKSTLNLTVLFLRTTGLVFMKGFVFLENSGCPCEANVLLLLRWNFKYFHDCYLNQLRLTQQRRRQYFRCLYKYWGGAVEYKEWEEQIQGEVLCVPPAKDLLQSN